MKIQLFSNNLQLLSPYVHPKVPPKIAPFTFGDEAMNYGETVQAQCTISGGDLPVNVTWYYNGLPLETYLGVYTEKRGNRINNLMIDSVVGKHMGNYTCVAVNRAGIVQHSAELRVNGAQKNSHYFL